jgi:hypothetical protein
MDRECPRGCNPEDTRNVGRTALVVPSTPASGETVLMQAERTRAWFSISVSTMCKGKARSKPVWVMRYRLPSGKDSSKVLGAAWTKRGRPPSGYLTRGDALLKAEAFVEEQSTENLSARCTFRAAVDEFTRYCAEEKGLRGSTLHGYGSIGERLAARPWRDGLVWGDCGLDTFTRDDVMDVRRELIAVGRNAETLNHYRRVVRGVFGTHPMLPFTPSPARSARRLSEIRALKIGNVDFEVGVLRFEDGFTTSGGHAGNKGRRVRSVPMTANVRTALAPFCEGKIGEMLVFEHSSKPGEPICGTALYRRFISASERASGPACRPAPHVRHTGDPRLQAPRDPADDGPPPHHHDRTLPALRTGPRGGEEADGALGAYRRRRAGEYVSLGAVQGACLDA